MKKIRLGDLLVSAGMIKEEDLKTALEIQKENPDKRLGDIFIEKGIITEEELINFLGKQLNIPYIDLSSFNFTSDILRLLPKKIIEEYRVIPIGKVENKILLAMADPLDVIALDNISLATSFIIEPVIASSSEIERIIERYFSEEADAILDSLRQITFSEDRLVTADVPVASLVNSLIERAYNLKASDLHLEPRENDLRLRYRIDGVTYDFMPLPKEIQNQVISRIKVLSEMDITEVRLPQEGRFNIKIDNEEIEVRAATMPTIYGEKVALRVLRGDKELFDLNRLGLSDLELKEFEEIITRPNGMVIISGPTGSGKSTTFYAILRKLNIPGRSIFTIEDPVEYPIYNVNQTQINPKIGLDFSSAFQSSLRQIPDVIMVGEIRDYNTANFATQSALAGQLVFSTIHAYDSAGAITRLINMGVEPYLISSSLIAVISQRLIRKLCRFCKIAYKPEEEILKKIGIENIKDVNLFRAKGCKKCHHTGYSGRIGVFELMKMKEKIRELILKKASSLLIFQSAVEDGMTSIKDNILKKMQEGLTSYEEAKRVIYWE